MSFCAVHHFSLVLGGAGFPLWQLVSSCRLSDWPTYRLYDEVFREVVCLLFFFFYYYYYYRA